MFPGGEGMPDLNALMQQAQQMQDQMLQAQAELEEARVEGTAGGGLVKATVTGTGDLVSLTISPEVCDPDDTETLSDLVVAAIRDAATTAQNQAVQKLGPLGGLGEGGLGGMLGGGAAGGDSPGDEPDTRGQLGF